MTKINLKANPFYLTDEEIRWVEDTKNSMNDQQKVGQLFCLMGGDYDIETLKHMVQDQGIGAILYRPAPSEEIQKNFQQLDQVAAVPYLKAANLEEGGSGGISDGTLFGWPMTEAAANSEEIVEKFAMSCAKEGKRAGINWTFSPVSDLDLNSLNPITNVRSFGSEQSRVESFTRKYVETVQKYGIAACAKHFPGDGVDFRDHHLHPTYNSLSADEWYESYGKIYQNIIDAGLLSVMVGHIVQPNVEMRKNPDLKFEDCLPGSMSKELLTGVLREDFGFNGVITTDATIMGGYCMAIARRDAIPASIMAGSDMLVFSTDFQEDYGYMMDALKDGRLSRERLEEAVTRILALKAVTRRSYPEADVDVRAAAEECADHAVTLVKNIQDVLPVTKEHFPKIRLVLLGEDELFDGSVKDTAVSYLKNEGFYVEIYEPYKDDLHGTSGLPDDRLTLYLCNMPTRSNQTTIRISWCKKHALDSPRFVNEEKSIFISLSNPYHLQDVPRVRTYINCYSATKALLTAALDKILGKSEFKGVSPVDAFCGLPDTRL